MTPASKDRFRMPVRRIGILGGGQLGRMMIYRAKPLGLHVSVLDESDEAPASRLADRFVRGSLYDPAAIDLLAKTCDVLTFEIEHVDVDAVERIAAERNISVHPSPRVLRTIQDKLIQKRMLADAGVPVPRFQPLPDELPGRDGGTAPRTDAGNVSRALVEFGVPCVQKSRTGGYDGRGVSIVRDASNSDSFLPGPTMVEELVSIRKELAVLIARGIDGSTAVYPIVEMVFDERANILQLLRVPADIPDEVQDAALRAAEASVVALSGVGVFAVELFWTTDGRVLVNEIAPRPHNSGHFSIEGCVTDQFEQHLRAVCDLPLGSTEQVRPSAMINLLGAPNAFGKPVVTGLRVALAFPDVKFHWYEKSEVRPNRKMGHVTVLGSTIIEAEQVAIRVAEILRVSGEGTAAVDPVSAASDADGAKKGDASPGAVGNIAIRSGATRSEGALRKAAENNDAGKGATHG